MQYLSGFRRVRRHRLGGSALALATLVAAVPAQAQVATVSVTGSRTLVSQQANVNAESLAIADGAGIVLDTGPISGSAATLSDNDLGVAARGNKADQSLVVQASDLSGAAAAHLVTGGGGAMADGGAVIATIQSNHGSMSDARLFGTHVALDAGDVSGSTVSVLRDTQEAIALGNDASSRLALTGSNLGTGAGILSLQSTDGSLETSDDSSPVGAWLYGQTSLAAGDVSGSTLAISGTLGRAIAYGNAATNALSVQGAGITTPVAGDLASQASAGQGGTVANAGYAILSSQYLGASIKARAGNPTYGSAAPVITAGSVDSASLTDDGNSLIGVAYGNQSANSLDIGAVSIASAVPGGGSGAVATVTAVQRLGDDGRVTASTSSAPMISVAGDVADGSLSASMNSLRAFATGNRADGNLMTVSADNVDMAEGGRGAARVDAAGVASTSGTFSVNSVQDSGLVPISAGARAGLTGIAVAGGLEGSLIKVDGNSGGVAATRNDATNGVTIAANGFRSSADLLNLQTGSGSVVASADSGVDPGGAAITLGGPVHGSSLSVSGNQLSGAAIGNTAANSLAVTGTMIGDGGGHDGADAGVMPNGQGAAAMVALANNQQLGQSEAAAPAQVTAQVFGRFAMSAGGVVDGASLAVDGNRQAASALGSTAVNRVSIAAAALGKDGAPAATSALSSAQTGNAAVRAASDMQLGAPGGANDSTLSLSGNTNQVLAVVNDVDNGLTIAATAIKGWGGDGAVALVSAAGASIAGGDVLASSQRAAGSASASATTAIGVGGTAVLDASRFMVADSATSAEASGNRALNAVSLTAGGGNVDIGLVSDQASNAVITATALTQAGLPAAGSPGAPAWRDASFLVSGNSTTALARGNVADNEMTISGFDKGSGASTMTAAGAAGDPTVQAPAALLNRQVNDGSVSASAAETAYGVPLNGGVAAVTGSNAILSANTVTASAYGNAATNVVTIASPGAFSGAAIANVQANAGAVTAQVTGAHYRISSGPAAMSALTLSGNQLMASAVGNQATSMIMAPR